MENRIKVLEKNLECMAKKIDSLLVLTSKLQKKSHIEVLFIKKTSFDNGNYWVWYKVNGKIGVVEHEYNDIQEIENYFNSDLEKNLELQNNRYNISDLSNLIQNLIYACRVMNEGIFHIFYEDLECFTDSEDEEEQKKILKSLEDEVKKLNLEYHFEFNTDVTAITVYCTVLESLWFKE